MRHTILAAIALTLAAILGNDASAQNTLPDLENDSVRTAIRLKGLEIQRDKLQAEIKEQDAKRNKQLTDVSAATTEEMNNRQDSICLALRSQLVDINLQIKEISPKPSTEVFVQQYNNLLNKQEQTSNKDEKADNAEAVKESDK